MVSLSEVKDENTTIGSTRYALTSCRSATAHDTPAIMLTSDADGMVDGVPHDLYPGDLATLDRAALERAVQRRAQTVYLGGGVVLARVLTRYKLLLHTADRGFGGHVMMDGYWEIWLNQFFARTMKPGMRIIDVGANYGYYTMLFADIATHTGQVFAVEPNPAAADLLRQSVRLNGFDRQVQVIETALGATQGGLAQLVVPDGEPKNASVKVQPTGDVSLHQVTLTTLDHLTTDLERVDFIKIDAEGSEEAIIAGTQNLLHRCRPSLLLEFNAARSVDPSGLLARLLDIYGSVTTVGYEGNPELIDSDTVLTTHPGEDWMLYFASPAA
jgi:FkbM family methyltransferase